MVYPIIMALVCTVLIGFINKKYNDGIIASLEYIITTVLITLVLMASMYTLMEGG